MALVDKNAAMMIEQKDLSAEKLSGIIEELLDDPMKFAAVGQNARDMALVDAKKRICDIIVSLAA